MFRLTATRTEPGAFSDVLRALLGKLVTIVNAESYENAPVGHQIRAGFYRAKVTGLGSDYLVVMTEFEAKGSGDSASAVKQFIPLAHVKRISLMKGECLLHI